MQIKYKCGEIVKVIDNPFDCPDINIGEHLVVMGMEVISGEVVYCLKNEDDKLVYSIDHFETTNVVILPKVYDTEEECEADVGIPEPVCDMVNHPAHYNQYPCEVIDIEKVAIKDLKGLSAFCLGNAIKYVLRSPFKGSMKQDLEKARWYITRLIEELED